MIRTKGYDDIAARLRSVLAFGISLVRERIEVEPGV